MFICKDFITNKFKKLIYISNSDDDVYKHFKLSVDDIKLINDTNVIGYKNIVKLPTNIVENEIVVEEVKPKVKKLRIVKDETA
jgi:hypothetical protein